MEAISESCRVFTHFLRTLLPRCHTLLLFVFPVFSWYCVFFSVAAAAQPHIGSCAGWVTLVAGQPCVSPTAVLPREQGRATVPPPWAAASRPALSTTAALVHRAARPPALLSQPPFPVLSCPTAVPHAPTRPRKPAVEDSKIGRRDGQGFASPLFIYKRQGHRSERLPPSHHLQCLSARALLI